MHPLLNIAINAARRAGKIITRYIEQRDSLIVHQKGINDLVTMVDQSAEQDIIETIRRAYPSHGILGEETGHHPGDEFTWVIDPLDGTMNYIHGFPQFAVSIGIKFKGQIEHGVIYDPVSQDLYTATRGTGAQLNDRRIRTSKRETLEGSLIGSSFPYHDRHKYIDKQFNVFKEVFTACADVRRTGSAALNLAYVASGRLDGFWESGLKEWDMAAGVLLVREAGGFLSDFAGGSNYLTSGKIIAGTRKIQAELLRIITPHQEIDTSS